MKWLLLLGAFAGCVRPDVQTCAGKICPLDAVCLSEEQRCVDPTELDVDVSPLEFSVDCGATTEIIRSLRNFGPEPLSFSARSTAQGITPMPADGVVAPGEIVDLHIVADPGPVSIPGSEVDGIVTISSDVGTRSMHVVMTTHGAVASILGSLDFGETGQNIPKDRVVTIRNDGNEAMGVTLSELPATFTSIGPTTAQIDPGADASFRVRFLPPALATYSGTASLQIDGHLCQPVPATLGVLGVASGSPLLIDETTINFAPVPCGSPAVNRPLGLVNNLAGTQDITVSLASTDMFSTVPSLSIAPASDAVLGIMRRATVATDLVGAHETTLLLTGAVTKTVHLSQPINAPVLSVNETKVVLAWPTERLGQIMITNSGNTIGNVKVEPPTWSHNGVQITVSPAVLQIPAGVSLPITFSINATTGAQPGVYKGTITAGGECSVVPLITVPYTVAL